MPLISASLITRNEEANLAACLASIDGHVDEIVIVDTGSTDRTIEIAKGFGAYIEYFPWCDDFSAARNCSLDHCSGDWIFALDADDRLKSGDLRQAVLNTLKNVLLTTTIDPVGTGDTVFIRTAPQLFRHLPSIRWEGRVHERLTAISDTHVELSDIRLEHIGHTASENTRKHKAERNCRLAYLEMLENPTTYSHFILGQSYVLLGDYSSALISYEKAYEMWAKDPMPRGYLAALAVQYAEMLTIVNGRHHEALEILKHAGVYVEDANILYHYALTLTNLEFYYEALHWFEMARACAKAMLLHGAPFAHMPQGMDSFIPDLGCASIWEHLGRADRAKAYRDRAEQAKEKLVCPYQPA